MDRTKPEIDFPEGEAPKELVIEDVIAGDGAEVAVGSVVSAHYVGVAFSSGEEFDSSWDRGEPLRFPVGKSHVIEGWDRGLLGMRVGGRRRLTVPSAMAYGSRGAGGVIGPDETLIFVVDLMKIA